MPPVAELGGRVGRFAPHQPTEHGLTLTARVLQQRVTACAQTADTLAVTTQQGGVYVVHLTKQRFVCLDTLRSPCTAAAFLTRLSRKLFVGCADGGIHCYDASTSSRLAQLPGHRTAITALSTKADTEQLLSASVDTVVLWDMATFRQRCMLGEAAYGSSHAAISPAGNIMAAASPAGTITLWDAKSLREVGQLQTPCGQQQHQRFSISSISISADERWLLVGCKAPALLLLYSLQQHRALRCGLQLPHDMFDVAQVQVLPDSSSAAVLTGDGCISFVDFEACCLTGQLQLTFPGCRACSFSTDPRANSMAVVCSDGLLRLYDLGVVRAKQQQAQAQPRQLQRLLEAQLQHLATISVDAQSAGAAGRQLQPRNPQADQAAGGPDVTVLSDVANIGRNSRAAAAKHVANTPAGASSGPKAAAGQLRVRQLAPQAAALNRRKLQEILLAYGEFPARYRQLIWEQLLQLPHSTSAFAVLQDRGLHPAYQGMARQLQTSGAIKSSVALRLAACLSQLAHWCPLFGEAGFLPDFAFPLVKLFGPKAQSSFEAVATLLLNWCKGWFELFPNPPLPLLRRFLLMLSQHDLQLGEHLQQLGVPALERLWRAVNCGMSELLPDADDWLLLWDHCLAAPGGPAFYYSALAAYLISQRTNLLAATTGEALSRLLDSRPVVDVRRVVKLAYKLHQRTPQYAQLGVTSLSPLPAGDMYPAFTDYPKGSVELQQLERQRIQEAEEALIRRRQVVAELQQRSKQVAFEAAALTNMRQQLAALDAQRRAALRAIDDALATAGARLDDRAKEEKLRQIRCTEEAYQASLSLLRAEWSSELAALKSDVEHKRRMAAAALKARQEEEDIKALEFQAQQRLWALRQEEVAAAGSSALRDAAATQATALAAQLQRKAAEWQAQDDERSLLQQHELARNARMVAAAEQEAALQAAKGLLLAQELQTQEELAKVEHQRRLRQLAEAEAQLTAQQLQLQRDRQAVAAAAGRHTLQEQAQARTARFTQQQEARAAPVAAEHESLQQQLTQLHLSAADLGSSARLADAEEQLAHMEATLAAADQEHAQRVAQLLSKLQARQQAAMPQDPSASPAAAQRAAAAAAVEEAAEDRPRPAVLRQPEVGSSLEAVQARLATIRQRRAELESLYGEQVDAEVQRRITADGQTQSAAFSGGAAERQKPSMPASKAPASNSGGSGSSRVSQAASTSVDVSAELENLLAEAEAEVQRELHVVRMHLQGSALPPKPRTRSPTRQSSDSLGRGETSVVQQGSTTVYAAAVARNALAAAVAAAGLLARPADSNSSSSASSSSSRVHSERGVELADKLQSSSAGAIGSGGAYQPILLSTRGIHRTSADTDGFMSALSGGGHMSSSEADDASSDSKPSSLSFDAPAAGEPGQAPGVTPTLGRRTRPRTGPLAGSTGAAAAAAAVAAGAEGPAHSPGSNSVNGFLQRPSAGSTAPQGEALSGSEVAGAAVGLSRGSRGLEGGRVSSELRRSSSATSEELEQLLQQLSQYEDYLLEEISQNGLGPPRDSSSSEVPPLQQASQPPQLGKAHVGASQQPTVSLGTSIASSMSWSQTLAGVAHMLPAVGNS